MAAKRNLTTKTTIDNLIGQIKSTFVKQTTFNALNDKVTTLIGTDTNKSVRRIANEELAAQLIPASADEALDTLQEIAAWIQNHPNDASAMNAAIAALEAKTVLGTAGTTTTYVAAEGTYVDGTTYYTDNTGETTVDTTDFTAETDVSSYFVAKTEATEYATVKAYVEAAIAALKIGDYAKAADLTALASRVETLEGKATNVTASSTNGNITVDDEEVTVYTLPDTVVHSSDVGAYDANKNGFIKIKNTYVTVYVLPDDVLHADDIVEYSADDIARLLADDDETGGGNGEPESDPENP